VPTTVLAQQHYQTFNSRFAGFAPVVDVISRFRSAREQREILDRAARGQIDVLIGTHRILQSDVSFKDLGLLIVDEEQRFGVAQKERLKTWRTNVDVLTLTATPIPRTLHMSLVGVRDMSIIETPPEDRLPVQTYVLEYREEIIRDAIRREIKRGGQVYFVYNRVQTIDKMAERLGEMLPDAKIQVAHGQMPEELLEKVMLDFYEGRDDVLICTSIIENGLDVPNANTIIVYDADRFGLSQLYQMRGRVGRSPRLAYAYFTYREEKVLSEIAEKRLQAIKEFAELGAGFKIAMRDLEIRGAGNLLGAQQSGHIVSVGFEMYCRLLDEAVQEQRDGVVVEPPPEPVLEFNIDAYLDGDYIGDAMHKIEIYQRIAAIRNEHHISEILAELIDRFGDPTKPVINLLTVARVKNLARQLGIRSLIERKDVVEIIFGDKPNVDVPKLFDLKAKYPARISILPGPPEIIRIKTAKLADPLLDWLAGFLSAVVRGSDAN
jgi:transcription-repair coupling factor (superfamily II helicase)